MDIRQRGPFYRLEGRIRGQRVRLSLRTKSRDHATSIRKRVEEVLAEGNESKAWEQLSNVLPRPAFQKLASLTGYTEPGSQVKPEATTWEILLALYNAHCEQRIARNEMRASSKKRNDISLREFSVFLSEQGITKLRDVKSPVIEQWKAWRIKRINQTKQARNGAGLIGDIEAVHRVFQFGMRLESDWVIKNPVRTVRRKGGEPNPYTEEELQAMFENAGEHRFTLLVLLHTGLRAGDSVKLRWEQVNFGGGFIDLQTEKCSTQAWIPLSPELLFALQSEWQRRKALPGETVLLNQWHRPMAAGKYLQDRVVRIIGERAGVRGAKAHRFRHTFISKKVASGAGYADVGRMVGDSAATIEKYYAKFSGVWKNRLKQFADADFIPQVDGTLRAHSPTQEGVTH